MGKKLFDYVIGNPPYQEDTVGDNNQAKPVYNLFMDSVYEIAEKTELITPARFLMKAGATPKAWNEKMLASEKFSILVYEADSSKIFNGVDIKGGVAVSYYDNTASHEPIGVFIVEPLLNSIFQKVRGSLQTNIGNLVHSPDSYRFTDVLFHEHPEFIGRTDKQHARAVSSNVFSRYPEIFSATESTCSVKVIGGFRLPVAPLIIA